MDTKKITLQDLVNKAEEKRDSELKTKKLYVESLGGYIVVKKPNLSLVEDMYEYEGTDMDYFIVQNCTIEPNLKDEKLQKAYNAAGFSVIKKIFEPGEIPSISKEILKFAGFGDSVKEIKN